jgi:tetratricopeptide (TPR) repeat protein
MNNGTLTATPYPRLSQARQLAAQGKFDAAARELMVHLKQHPGEPQGLAELGHAAMRLGALGQAEHFLRQAILRGATDFEVRRHLASVMGQQEKLAAAEAMLRTLIGERNDAALRGSLANVLERLGRSAEALQIQGEMVAEQPESQPAWLAYGHGLRANGRVDEAIAAYRRSIGIDEEFGEAWWALASIKRRVFDSADIDAMRRALDLAVDARNIAPLHFALARALHDLGDYETAFHHYSEGNRIRAEGINYNARELTEEIEEVERIADRDFIARLGSAGQGGGPVFIVCLPRSGSTLLEQMLGCHPAIEPVGELPYIPAILRTFMEMATRRGKITVPRAVAGMTAELAGQLGADYLQRASLHRKTDRGFFIDKLPQNWNNVLFIRKILPNARFIDIRRPAMDCCFSNFSLSFTTVHASSFALRDVGQSYVDYVRLMRHLDAVAPGMVHHTSYRGLVEDPREEVERALCYLGLEWDDRILEFHKLDRVVRTPSSEQVRRPLNRDGIEVWKPYSRWLDPLREVLGDLAEG